MKRLPRRLGVLILCATLASACQQTLSLPVSMRTTEAQPGQMESRREYWDKGLNPTQLKSEIEGLAQRGGGFVKHGRERTFYRSGQIEVERHWTSGEPTGIWRAWWESGTQKSVCEFTRDGSATQMSFWHANGKLEAQGPAINGRRIGHWEFFHANGAKEFSGDFQGGIREGEWTSWDECGDVIESAHFERGVKVDHR